MVGNVRVWEWEILMMDSLVKLWREEQGATAVEYGLMVALIAVVMIVSVQALGTAISTKFQMVATSIDNAAT